MLHSETTFHGNISINLKIALNLNQGSDQLQNRAGSLTHICHTYTVGVALNKIKFSVLRN
jgi:hypothetical protein